MSAEVMPPPVESEQPLNAAENPAPENITRYSELAPDMPEDLLYKPIPAWAPVGLVVGLCSAALAASLYALPIPLLGLVFSGIAWRQISRARADYGGYKMALTGFALSLMGLAGGLGWHGYVYLTEVPEGYERLSLRDLSSYKPSIEDGQLVIAPDARALDGQKVFMKGYMYPTGQLDDIQSFVLCKDTGECCFGGKPAMTDIVFIEFVNDTRARFRELQLVNVAGTFRAKKRVFNGELAFIYSLEAEYFK